MDFITPGSSIGPYLVLEVLPEGQGGMSRVYKARGQLMEGDPYNVALKVMRTGSQDPKEELFFFEALNNEVEILRRLRHPNIVRIYPIPLGSRKATPFIARDISLPGEPWYCVMEYLEGGSLYSELKRRNRLPIGEGLEIASQTAMALEYIHARHVVHRDVKPDNILFRASTGSGRRIEAVLVDFGIAAKLKRVGMSAGSVFYMPPERLRAARGETPPEMIIDQAAGDIYGLGAILYQMLTGHRPFEGHSRDSLTSAILHTTPEFPRKHNPEIPPRLEQVILRALEKDPSRRPTAEEMITWLEQAMAPPWVAVSESSGARSRGWKGWLPRPKG